MKIERQLFPALMRDFKRASDTGGRLSAVEVGRILNRGLRSIKHTYQGATSEAGLADHRKALAMSYRAAARDWTVTKAGVEKAKTILGRRLNGKGRSAMAELERDLRNSIHTPRRARTSTKNNTTTSGYYYGMST
jgi:hypothetical protein